MSQQGINVPELAKDLGISRQAVYKMLGKQDLNTSVLRKLSQLLDVPMGSFLDEDVPEVAGLLKDIKALKADAELLRQRVEAVEKRLMSVPYLSLESEQQHKPL